MRMTRGLRDLCAWAGFGLLVWGAWLAFPRVPGEEPGPALRAVLVDASASAVRRRPGWGAHVRELVRLEERSARAAGEELAVVLFGRDVLRLRESDFSAEVGWLEPAFSVASFGAGTELDQALSSVEGQLIDSAREAGSVVLVGDGEWTGADPAARIMRLARAGVHLERVAIGAQRWPDLGVIDVRLPSALVSGERLAAVCDLSYQAGEAEVSGELLVECVDADGRRAVTEALALPRAGGSWSVSVDLGPCRDGEVTVSARVSLTGSGALSAGDPVRENDSATRATRCGGMRLGLATAEPARMDELQAWLERAGGPGVQWELVSPGEVQERLPGRDLFVSYDVSTARLPERWLGPFLEHGGGWLALGGWGLLSDYWPEGVGESAPASELLPLVPSQGDEPQRAVIFCVDGSGSMTGAPFESVRDALGELVPAALPSDELQMRFFTGALGPVIEIGGRGRRDRVQGMRELFDARVPGGSTDILLSLELLAEARGESDLPALVLLLSDGRDDNAFQVPERAAALRAAFAESRTRLSVIGIGTEADLDLLAMIAGSRAEVLVVEELEELADLFRREVARERVREGEPVGVTVHKETASEDLRALVESWGERAAWPQVERLARTEARPGAEVLLRTTEDLPLLGLGRVGEGWAACFPALLETGWAPGFQGASDVFGPLWSLLGRGGADEAGGPSLTLRGEELVLRLGSEGASWPPIVHVELFGGERGAEERRLGACELTLGSGVVSGALGRRSGALGALEGRSSGRLRALFKDPESGEELAVLALERPLEAEFRPFLGERLELGALASPATPTLKAGLAVPDERAPIVIGLAVLLLAGAALMGRWRTR